MSLTWFCTNQNGLYPECGTSDLLHSDTPSQRTSAPIDKTHRSSSLLSDTIFYWKEWSQHIILKQTILVRSLWEPFKQGKSKLTARRFHVALIFCVIPLKTFPDCTDTLISYSSKLYLHELSSRTCYFVLTTFHVILIMFVFKPTVPHTCQAGWCSDQIPTVTET